MRLLASAFVLIGAGTLGALVYKLSKRRPSRRPVRIYLDGCFDLMHPGHTNALRQAKMCGDVLIAGVVGDDEIYQNKGPPIMTLEERVACVESAKWVDEVLSNVPYNLNAEFLHELFTKHRIDYVVHGDDP